MKKQIVLIAAAVAALFAVSCTEVENPVENTPIQSDMKEVSLTANTEVTKTSYDTEGAFSWTKGDQISVWCSDEQFHTLTATESGSSVVFKGQVPSDVYLGWYAFFPADENHADCKFSLPSYKDLSVTNSADLPMVGEGDGETYSFKHCVGAAKFTFTNFPEFVETVDITFTTLKLKVTGLFSIYKDSDDNTVWCWSAAYGGTEFGSGPDSELVYSRKVRVEDGAAVFYLPYEWTSSDGLRHDSTVEIVGYDSDGNAYNLLTKTVGKLGDFTRAEVKVITPLAVPAYIPPVDWTKVDWTSEAVVSPANVGGLNGGKVLADANYIYVNLSAPSSLVWDNIYCYFGNGEGNVDLGGFGWKTALAAQYRFKGVYADGVISMPDAETMIVTEGDIVNYYFAFKRNVSDIISAPGKIYLGFHIYNGADVPATFPKTWNGDNCALEVTLP